MGMRDNIGFYLFSGRDDDVDAGRRATLGLSAINGGAPSSGGQISSTWEPRILQFGLKILY